MRVIRKGTQQVVCDRCGSLLEYEWRDIHDWGEKGDSYTVTCPECAKLIDVDPIIIGKTDYFNGYYVNDSTSAKSITLGDPGFQMFQRDALYASNGASNSAATTVLDSLFAAATDVDATKTEALSTPASEI